MTAAYTATNQALKETLMMTGAQAPRAFLYDVRTTGGLVPRANHGGGIDFIDRAGRIRFSFLAPFMQSGTGKTSVVSDDVKLHLEQAPGGYRVKLTPNAAWLRRHLRRGPVAIDPSVYHIEDTQDTRLRFSGANQDCYIKDGTFATTSQCGGTEIHLGYHTGTQRRMLLRFDVQNSLPKGIHVLDAELGLHLYGESGSGSAGVDVHRLTRSWTTAATWNSYDGTNAWTSPGGDFDSTPAASATVGTAPAWYKWYPRQLVQSWIDGSTPNNGLLVKESSERTLDNDYYFDSSQANSANWPYLDVVYEPQTGKRPYYKFASQQLSDRMDANVNVASGNLMVHNSDLKVNGTGLDLGVDRYYNDQLERTSTSLGTGWTLGAGADVHLRFTSDAAVFYAPSGYVVSSQKNADGTFSSPKGIDATLCKVGTGGCSGSDAYALTWNHSQQKLNFSSAGRLTAATDQNNNKIAYGYDASGHMTSITDTQGRTSNLSYNGSGKLAQVTDSAGRTYQYGYDANGNLTSYMDAAGKTTQYAYGGSPSEMTQITDPNGSVTRVTYTSDVNSKVASLTRVNASGAGDSTWSFSYSSASSPCSGSDAGKTVVTDPNGHPTTYCYDQDGKVTTVFDAKGKKQSTSYTPNGFVATYTSASNATSGFNTTVTRDPVSNSVTGTDTKTGAASDLTSSFNYSTTSTAPYAPYYPQSATNTQGHKQAYTYDTFGNMTSSTDDLGDSVSLQHDAKGNVTQATDANNHTTSYGYDAQGNLTSVTPPAPLGQTMITYDNLSRTRASRTARGSGGRTPTTRSIGSPA